MHRVSLRVGSDEQVNHSFLPLLHFHWLIYTNSYIVALALLTCKTQINLLHLHHSSN